MRGVSNVCERLFALLPIRWEGKEDSTTRFAYVGSVSSLDSSKVTWTVVVQDERRIIATGKISLETSDVQEANRDSNDWKCLWTGLYSIRK
jgi:hypothetical protein